MDRVQGAHVARLMPVNDAVIVETERRRRRIG